jgi:hypothetical protein
MSIDADFEYYSKFSVSVPIDITIYYLLTINYLLTLKSFKK